MAHLSASVPRSRYWPSGQFAVLEHDDDPRARSSFSYGAPTASQKSKNSGAEDADGPSHAPPSSGSVGAAADPSSCVATPLLVIGAAAAAAARIARIAHAIGRATAMPPCWETRKEPRDLHPLDYEARLYVETTMGRVASSCRWQKSAREEVVARRRDHLEVLIAVSCLGWKTTREEPSKRAPACFFRCTSCGLQNTAGII